MMPDVEFLGADTAQDYVNIQGPADEYVTMLGASSPTDVMCAQQVKGAFYAAAGCTIGTLGMGLFGVYKLFKGKPAAGVTSLVAGALTLGIGRMFASSAATRFEACRTGGGAAATVGPLGPTTERRLHKNYRTGATFYYGDPGYGAWLAAQGNDTVGPA